MELDLLIPFAILLILVVYLIYTRNKFEKNIVSLYEEKFEDWKKHSACDTEKLNYKELVGLIFKENDRIKIELLNQEVKRRIVQGKFDIKE